MGMKSIIKKLPFVLIGIYMVVYCTILVHYNLEPKLINTPRWILVYRWYLPMLLFIPLVVPKVRGFLDKLTNVTAWTFGGVAVVVTGTIIHLTSSAGFCGSWSTLSLLLVVTILVMNLTKTKVTSGEGLLLGCGCALVVSGVLEIVYQTGLIFYHDYFGEGMVNYSITMSRQILWILTGGLVIVKLAIQHRGLVHLNGLVMVCLSIAAILDIIWFASGMFINVHFYKGVPSISEPNLLMTSVIRSSKAFLYLASVMLFLSSTKTIKEMIK